MVVGRLRDGTLPISRERLEERACTERYVVLRMRKVETSTASGGYTLSVEDTGSRISLERVKVPKGYTVI